MFSISSGRVKRQIPSPSTDRQQLVRGASPMLRGADAS